ncbi:MAG: hypothetical protein JSS02_08145 [Planctomycetes bacterium]|nr:hypothetical protein [Planctomycetota bacterium]
MTTRNALIKQARGTGRRGGFSIVVLVCLLISTMVLASLLRIMWLHSRQTGREQTRVQAVWLAEAGLDRAADRLQRDRNYAGETWKIANTTLGGREGASVVIRVEPDTTQLLQRLIVVEATFPEQGPDHARVTRQTTVTLRGEE